MLMDKAEFLLQMDLIVDELAGQAGLFNSGHSRGLKTSAQLAIEHGLSSVSASNDKVISTISLLVMDRENGLSALTLRGLHHVEAAWQEFSAAQEAAAVLSHGG